LPDGNHEWTHLCLQDFKSIEDYNRVVHKVCAKLHFCEKELSKVDNIEKILQTMFPSDRFLQHQYRARNYQHYSEFISDLLQAEKHDELTIKNHYQRSVGTASLPKLHHNAQGQNKSNFSKNKFSNKNGKNAKCRRNRRKNRKLSKMMGNDACFQKGIIKCKACRCFRHTTKKCHTSKHLVSLYQKFLRKDKKVQGSGYEAHFTIPSDTKYEVGYSSKDQMGPSTDEPTLNLDDYMDTWNAMVEYASNDVFGDLI
jgi:hypothetical protein